MDNLDRLLAKFLLVSTNQHRGPLIFPPMIQLWTLSVLDEQDNPNSTEERQGEGGLNLMMF
ncbi:unnamed protein product [Clavelina lepadiformis]|uniref:Uncharacterized protein n=1 Tax=Clavelina lepadiformis TaxID=159417 RepID=A0ABP0GHS8_CLALP